jgi:hypothetical protein
MFKEEKKKKRKIDKNNNKKRGIRLFGCNFAIIIIQNHLNNKMMMLDY